MKKFITACFTLIIMSGAAQSGNSRHSPIYLRQIKNIPVILPDSRQLLSTIEIKEDPFLFPAGSADPLCSNFQTKRTRKSISRRSDLHQDKTRYVAKLLKS
jgi:hypothetical protein